MYTVDRHTDVLGHSATEIDGIVVNIRRRARGLGQGVDTLQNGPILTVKGVLYVNVLGAESQESLDELIRVPDPNFMQFMGLVKGKIDRGRDAIADPHVSGEETVEIIRHAGAVDGIFSHGKPD